MSTDPTVSQDDQFVLRNPLPLPFRPLNGQLGFFEVRAQDQTSEES